eukprot:g21468.t1
MKQIVDSDTSFPDMLNAFYAVFEQNTICSDSPSSLGHHFRWWIGLTGNQPKESDGPRRGPQLSTQILCAPAGRALHSSLEHVDNKDTYVRLLLVDYSSAFNTII